MRCPYCEGNVLEVGSGLAAGGTEQVAVYWEVNDYHTHNPNRLMTEYRCSNDHHWKVTTLHGCPTADCAWNRRLFKRTVRIRGVPA